MIKRLKIKTDGLYILPFGVSIKLKNDIINNPVSEIKIALSGPVLSLFLYFVFAYSKRFFYDESIYFYLDYSKAINLSLFLINLVPCLPLDGGRIVKAALSVLIGGIRAYNIMIKISFILSFCIISSAIIIFLNCDYNFSLIMIGAFVLANLSIEKKYISKIALKEILYHKEKIKKDGFTAAKTYVAHKETYAREILRYLDINKYYVVSVIDDNGRIIKTLSESKILNALISGSIRLKIGEI